MKICYYHCLMMMGRQGRRKLCHCQTFSDGARRMSSRKAQLVEVHAEQRISRRKSRQRAGQHAEQESRRRNRQLVEVHAERQISRRKSRQHAEQQISRVYKFLKVHLNCQKISNKMQRKLMCESGCLL